MPFVPVRYAVVLSLFLPAASFAQSDAPLDLSELEPVDFTQLSRSEFIDKHEEALSVGWEPSMQLYARVDESLGQIVPQFSWSDEYTEAYGCLYDNLKGQDALGEANAMFTDMHKSIEYIYAHPDFSMLTMDQHEPFINLLQPSDIYLEASISCGIGALNAKAMKDSGLFEAYWSFVTQ